jgi:hypothetical protein
MKYIEWIRFWYPLPESVPDDVVTIIVSYAFNPFEDAW